MKNRQATIDACVYAMRASFRAGCQRAPEMVQFAASYLTRRGERIVRDAMPTMTDDELRIIAARAVRAGY